MSCHVDDDMIGSWRRRRKKKDARDSHQERIYVIPKFKYWNDSSWCPTVEDEYHILDIFLVKFLRITCSYEGFLSDIYCEGLYVLTGQM